MTIRKQIKIVSFLFITALLLSSCGALNPGKQAATLKKYNYDVESVRDLKAGGMAINSNFEDASLSSLTGVALGLLQKNLSLEAVVNMKVSNPTGEVAPMGPFKYLIEIQGKPFFEGSVNESLSLSNGQSKVVPLAFKANLFGVADERKGVEGLLSDILTRKSNGLVVLKIKPSVKIAGRDVYYPGYITVDSDLLKGVSSLIKK